MAGPVAVSVEEVSKRFRLYHQKYQSVKERILNLGNTPYEDFWALNDVNLEVYEGETVGILGRNGSGKSTLLKCISGILQPTKGQVVIRGHLAALLELGAGFQPELSGRENIYLNASLLGLSTREVDRRFDDIVAFAELEHFIDNQVKFYSSGMYVRLGFAVAVNVEPDILVVDEVLAVGDENFQRKCMDRVKQFQEEGRTILFVSHSPDQVRAICDRALVLDQGVPVGCGTPGEAVRWFRERLLESTGPLGASVSEETPVPEVPSPQGAERPVRIAEVTADYPGVDEFPYLRSGEPLTLRVVYEAQQSIPETVFVLQVHNSQGDMLVRVDTAHLGEHFDLHPGRGAVEFAFELFPFVDGAYSVTCGILSRLGGETYDWRESVAVFEVMDPGRGGGLVNLPVRVRLERDVPELLFVPDAASEPASSEEAHA